MADLARGALFGTDQASIIRRADAALHPAVGLASRRHRGAPALLVSALLALTPAARADEAPAADPPAPPTAAPSAPRDTPPTDSAASDTPWLAEVRAQRQAAEARHQANRAAFAARRRALDPWGAAQHEAREEAFERRREARRGQREQARGPLPAPGTPPGTPDTSTARANPDPGRGTPPQDWNNLWYFRGY
ncbi:hypothetical protein THSYN_21905 [Candidatus Thiodictyon syntrophicum]|uniref:Uncharacterized protein n=1 Tax=Candidatus Thiodictyon syntrophicum TaxID=1166950 RepID=A0A2K8UCK8_9GAMM|nr:hypothetical protein THSYN_21905 [Candidatus Thiodictyon syntrophicum]